MAAQKRKWQQDAPSSSDQTLNLLETQSSQPFLHFSNSISIDFDGSSSSDADVIIPRVQAEDSSKLRQEGILISRHLANDCGVLRSMDTAVGVNGEESGRTTGLASRPGHMEGVLWHLEVLPGRRRPAVGQHDLGLKHGGIFSLRDDPRLLLHSQPIEDAGPGGMVLEQALHLRLGVALSNLDGCDLPRWMRGASIAGLLMLCVRGNDGVRYASDGPIQTSGMGLGPCERRREAVGEHGSVW